jgi:CheY-like chemotaxis protein
MSNEEPSTRSPRAPRILVVDDNEDAAQSLAMLLDVMGHETRIAYDGLQAVALAESFRPHAILLDIGMPKMNGYEASQRIREQPWGKEIMLVALTGWAQEEDVRRAQEAGFDRHLVKPVEAAALRAALAEIDAR